MIFQKRGVDWPLMIFCLALIVTTVMAGITTLRSSADHDRLLHRAERVR